MKRNSVGVFVLLAAASCAPPKAVVFVDLDRVLAAESAFVVVPDRPFAQPRFGGVSGSAILDPSPPRSLETPALASRLAEARARLAEDREAALANLFDHLYKSYTKEVDHFRIEENALIQRELEAELKNAANEISAMLHRYADRRSPLVNRLALLVGFPFPAKERLRAPADNPVDRKRHAEALDLYARLAALEAEFEREVSDVFGRYYGVASQRRLALGLKVVERLDQFEQRARQEAQRAVAQVNAEIDVTLLDAGRIRLPATPGGSAQVQALPPSSESPFSQPPTAGDIISRREAVEADLQIWLGVHRYRLARTRLLGRDETETFIEWRNKLRAGR